MDLSEFYSTDFCQYSCYDNLRKIASAIDGQKNASRKLLYTVIEKNIKDPVKVLELAASVVSFAGYLHGDCSGVAVTLGQDFPGTNNLPLFQKKGNFGTRFAHEASAPRYIFTHGSDVFFKLFKKEDSPILNHQTFEGKAIEPMFYVPSLPMLLVNGSEGVSTGFAQKILPRNPDSIKKLLLDVLSDKQVSAKAYEKMLSPWFKGFNGTIEKNPENPDQYFIKGTIVKTAANKVLITEVPIGYDLKSYTKVLEDLEDKKFIMGYRDLSDNDIFKFEVQFQTKILKELTEEQLLQKLKLIKTVTENYTAMDESNKIREFVSAKEIFDYYIEVKLKFLQKRKSNLLDIFKNKIDIAKEKYRFINSIIKGTLKVYKVPKESLIKTLTKENYIKINDSFDYLLSMQISTFTKEKLEQLKNDIQDLETKSKELKSKTTKQLWQDDLNL